MYTPTARRVNFLFVPPEEDAGAWNFRMDDFTQRLQNGFPGASLRDEGRTGPRGAETFAFEVELDPGEWIEGLVTSPFESIASVTVEKATTHEGARFAAWLRDLYVPAPDLVQFTTEFALGNGIDGQWPLPADGDAGALADVLQAHIDEVEELLGEDG
ncbi:MULTISPECIES: hypothetical protein [Streptomyces]|uniref:hypothetical protein n=1 Tax=Streptomyces TaxID=1883 RepID=UPI00132E899A|nr:MULTISPECIES: hypothetical protein [Streptomyces]QHF92702.1 hypothetical protein DEH18_00900 [Streptomyces sp. NHF165]